MSVYRFWRDLGYAICALSSGIIADRFGFSWAIIVIGALTFLSGAIIAVVMQPKNASSGDQRALLSVRGLCVDFH